MGNFLKGFFDKFKLSDDYDEYEYDDEELDYKTKPERSSFKKEKIAKKSYLQSEEDDYQMNTFFDGKKKKNDNSKIVPLKKSVVSDLMHVCVLRPKSVKEANKASDSLIEGRAVILNLEGIEEAEAQRIMDFVFGTMYTINGKFSVISNFVFLFLPKSAELTSDLEESVKSFALDSVGYASNEFEIPIIRRDF